MLHPSWPVTAAGQAPPDLPESQDGGLTSRVLGGGGGPNAEGAKEHLWDWRHTCQSPCCQLGHWKLHSKWHHPLGFWEVMACLQRDTVASSCSWGTPGTFVAGSSNGAYCGHNVHQPHLWRMRPQGMTYMDTVTSSVGQVALGDPSLGIQGPGAHYWGHHQPPLKGKLMTAFGWKAKLMATFGWKDRMGTAFEWRDCDTIWQEQSHVLLVIPVICHGSYLHLLVRWVHVFHLYVVTAMLHLVMVDIFRLLSRKCLVWAFTHFQFVRNYDCFQGVYSPVYFFAREVSFYSWYYIYGNQILVLLVLLMIYICLHLYPSLNMSWML